MGNLRVGFVGIGRDGRTIPDGYLQTFVQFHLELPYYYARHSRSDVDVWIPNVQPYEMDFTFIGGGRLSVRDACQEVIGSYDVTVHWRKWCAERRSPEGKNVVLSQDHSYSHQWLQEARHAHDDGRLDGLLVFPGWHHRRVAGELSAAGISVPLIPGLTLGVDTDVYRPSDAKDPYRLLWASDPGRGLHELIPIFLQLNARDRRYRLTVTYPDYVRPESLAPYAAFLSHPAVEHLPSVRNGERLWRLFNESGVLPYPSTFMEPSSRCHRQAMAAGSMVLYPLDRGTPSELISSGINGIVERPHLWPDVIHDAVRSGRWKELGQNARTLALSESWAVQAQRFHSFFSEAR